MMDYHERYLDDRDAARANVAKLQRDLARARLDLARAEDLLVQYRLATMRTVRGACKQPV